MTTKANIGVQLILAATSIWLTIFTTKLYQARSHARLLRRQGCVGNPLEPLRQISADIPSSRCPHITGFSVMWL